MHAIVRLLANVLLLNTNSSLRRVGILLNKINVMKRGSPIFFLIILLIIFFSIPRSIAQKSLLHEFAKQKNARWKLDKRKADSLASDLGIPTYYVENDSNKVVILQRLGHKNKPVYYSTNNIDAAATISVDEVWNSNNEYPSLTGEGIQINLWDGGSIRDTHRELQNGPGSRITMRDLELPLSSHSTHIAGTMIATGVSAAARGMAGLATIAAWDLNDDMAEMAGAAAQGIVVSNHSYGPLCGWDYNSNNESWYWYGDPDISTTEDYEFGFYNQVSADLDYIAQFAPNYLIVKSAGNDRNETPSTYEHYVWDGTWKLVNVPREPDGGDDGYDCLTPMAVAKNILTVGAVDNSKVITSFSAYGPTDDGRIKPDVVANGYDIYSASSSADDSYASYNGTSMSTASATGSVALVHQLQNALQPGVQLLSATIKGILIHTATDLGNSGPDYIFGWGLLNIKEAADLIFANSHNQGKNIFEEELASDGEIIIPVTTQSTPFLKVTICWTDPAGQASSPSLNSRDSKLVNDLDVLVENSSSHEIYKPWILDVENPGAAATKNVNHVDNVEQIYITNPGENDFNIKISHSGLLSGGAQKFSLIISGIETTPNIYPPKNLAYTINESSIVLNWNPPESGTPRSYKIYRNGSLLAESENISFEDHAIDLDNVYQYYVTAEYELNSQMFESIGTNQITAFPQTLRSLPFIVDFEQETNEILYKNSLDGWQWGDSESLNCYYLDFSENTTKFIGADSYSAGDAIHVSDIAITAPLRLADYKDVLLSFDYMLKTGIYDAIDELHVVYKLQEEEQWHELQKLENAFDWAFHTIELTPEICKNGTQIGFYYDDFYQWGMGAGLDNIRITGTLNIQEDLSLESIITPESAMCEQEHFLDLTFSIKNTGNIAIASGETIEVRVAYNGIQKSSNYTLTQTLSIGSSISITCPNLIDPLPVGINNISLEISWTKDQSISNNTNSKNITVYGLPEITFVDIPEAICVDSDPITIQANPTGGTFQGEFLSGNLFNPTTAGIGEHEIFYTITDINGCTNLDSIDLIVVSIPNVSFTGLSSDYCINDTQVALSGIPPGGSFEGSGITGNLFDPSIAGAGTHNIKYIYTDAYGCSNTEEQQTTVHELTTLSFTFGEGPYCQYADPIQLTALPEDGTFYVNEEINDFLDPSQVPPGQVQITYNFQNAYGCNSSISKTVNIMALPEVTFDDPGDPFCYIDSNISLTAQPAGGTFYGNLVSDNIFNPVAAGIGPHEIIYIYADNYNCLNADTIIVEVNPLPEVNISGLSTMYCVNGESSQLTGLPSGGLFTGNGIVGNNFFPDLAGIGTQEITYFYSDVNGCSNSAQVSTNVADSTYIEILNLQDRYCQDDDPVTITVSPAGGILKIDDKNEHVLYPSHLTPGTIDISYEFENENNCVSFVDQFVEILALPEVNIEGLNEMYCQVNEDYLLTGLPSGGEFKLEGASVTYINPMTLDDGIYELIYNYTDEYGCVGNTFKTFEISSNPIAKIEGLAPTYCPNGEAVTISGIPSGGYFEGSGIRDNTFTPHNLLPGVYQITYTYNQSGCEVSTTNFTTITEPVVVTIENLVPEYCPEDSLGDISANPAGGLFSVTEVLEGNAAFNSYELTYSFTDEFNCTFSDLQSFQIRSKPEINFPDNLILTRDDTLYWPPENTDWSFIWPNDSTSSKIELIGSIYSNGNNALDVTVLDNYGCYNIFNIDFFIEMPLALINDNDQSEWLIFPNPADNYLKITVQKETSIKEPSSIKFLDLNGKIIKHWNDVQIHEGSLYLEIDKLNAGIYLISIYHDHSNHIEKIIIQR